MNYSNMLKDELVDLSLRRFLFNDYLPPLDSEEYDKLFDEVKNGNKVDDLVGLLEDNDDMCFEVVPKEFRKHPNLMIRQPYHATKNSAGMDVYTPVSITLPSGKSTVVATDLSFKFPSDLVCLGNIRSSLGIKQNITLSNSSMILDSDYFANKDNYGLIFIALTNHGNGTEHIKGSNMDDIKDGRVVQLTLTNFYIPSQYKSESIRNGGIGHSDNKGDE